MAQMGGMGGPGGAGLDDDDDDSDDGKLCRACQKKTGWTIDLFRWSATPRRRPGRINQSDFVFCSDAVCRGIRRVREALKLKITLISDFLFISLIPIILIASAVLLSYSLILFLI